MNKRLKKLAVQAGLAFSRDYDYWVAWDDEIERFAELVRQEEREACAKLCLEQDEYGCGQYAKAIRARGEK